MTLEIAVEVLGQGLREWQSYQDQVAFEHDMQARVGVYDRVCSRCGDSYPEHCVNDDGLCVDCAFEVYQMECDEYENRWN